MIFTRTFPKVFQIMQKFLGPNWNIFVFFYRSKNKKKNTLNSQLYFQITAILRIFNIFA